MSFCFIETHTSFYHKCSLIIAKFCLNGANNGICPSGYVLKITHVLTKNVDFSYGFHIHPDLLCMHGVVLGLYTVVLFKYAKSH